MDVSQRPAFNRLRPSLALPVLMKEMRSRMRGMRAPILLFITTGLTILVGLLIIAPQWEFSAEAAPYARSSMGEVGRSLFIGLVIMEGLLCALIAPALTAGAISIEREQQTLDLLLLTRLSCANIVLGKLFSSLGFLVMLLLCSLPVWAISFLLGGIAPGQVFWSLTLIFVSVTLFGAIALYCSTRYVKTATAVAVAYCLCVLWVVVIPIFLWLFASIYDNDAAAKWHDIPFVVFSAGCCATLALIPTAILSILIGMVFRHTLSRFSNFILWAGIAIMGMVILVGNPGTVGGLLQSGGEKLLLGNPILAMIAVIEPFNFFNYANPRLQFFERFFVPITVAITLFCAVLVIAQTIQELKRLRNGPPDIPSKRRHGGLSRR